MRGGGTRSMLRRSLAAWLVGGVSVLLSLLLAAAGSSVVSSVWVAGPSDSGCLSPSRGRVSVPSLPCLAATFCLDKWQLNQNARASRSGTRFHTFFFSAAGRIPPSRRARVPSRCARVVLVAPRALPLVAPRCPRRPPPPTPTPRARALTGVRFQRAFVDSDKPTDGDMNRARQHPPTCLKGPSPCLFYWTRSHKHTPIPLLARSTSQKSIYVTSPFLADEDENAQTSQTSHW